MVRTRREVEQERAEYEHRTFVNLVATIFLLCFAIALAVTITAVSSGIKHERCVWSGRKDCSPVQQGPKGPLILPAR